MVSLKTYSGLPYLIPSKQKDNISENMWHFDKHLTYNAGTGDTPLILLACFTHNTHFFFVVFNSGIRYEQHCSHA
ncbi:unnamed protein product [Cuscuta campestris]|uniref:Uncharacterized protein n=1 Tax=Cuscuta campestris TaxID=132261 RepID=A0A484LR90_9ASTE|nr:unnamed protein product [Cuscuta campestris]